jgi:hypothetical protein
LAIRNKAFFVADDMPDATDADPGSPYAPLVFEGSGGPLPESPGRSSPPAPGGLPPSDVTGLLSDRIADVPSPDPAILPDSMFSLRPSNFNDVTGLPAEGSLYSPPFGGAGPPAGPASLPPERIVEVPPPCPVKLIDGRFVLEPVTDAPPEDSRNLPPFGGTGLPSSPEGGGNYLHLLKASLSVAVFNGHDAASAPTAPSTRLDVASEATPLAQTQDEASMQIMLAGS